MAGDVPLFIVVKTGMFPTPNADNPMLGFVFDHVYIVIPPVLTVVNSIGPMDEFAHVPMSFGCIT